MSANYYADFLSKTIEDWKVEESMWDTIISNHFMFRNNYYFERKNTYDKSNGDTMNFLHQIATKLSLIVILIVEENLNCTVFGRTDLFRIHPIPRQVAPRCLIGTKDTKEKRRREYEFYDLKYRSFTREGTNMNPLFMAVHNTPWVILQREIENVPEYCLVPLSRLRKMSNEQYFKLLHFFNKLQNIRIDAISANQSLVQSFVQSQDMLTNRSEKIIEGEKNEDSNKCGRKRTGSQQELQIQLPKKMKPDTDLKSDNMLADILIEGTSNDYICSFCSKSFSSKGNLKTHIRNLHINPNRKPFECDICKKRFNQKGNMETHRKTHKRYCCEFCPMSFWSTEQLDDHVILLHKNNVSFFCYICRLRKSAVDLKSHIKSHKKEELNWILQNHKNDLLRAKRPKAVKRFHQKIQFLTQLLANANVLLPTTGQLGTCC